MPLGSLAQSMLTVSTFAIQSCSDGDAVSNSLECQIAAWTGERDNLASQIIQLLEGAEFKGLAIDEQQAKQFIASAIAARPRQVLCRKPGRLRALGMATHFASSKSLRAALIWRCPEWS